MKNALRTRFGTWDRAGITENCKEVVIIIMRLDAIISRLLYRLLSSQNIRFGFIRTHFETNQQLIIYAKQTNVCLLALRKTIFFHSFLYLHHNFPNSCNCAIVSYRFKIKKKKTKENLLETFFFFLDKFYN